MSNQKQITVTMDAREAEALSLRLSDFLCWAAGFEAARIDTDMNDETPMGVEAVRTVNIKIKCALDRADKESK